METLTTILIKYILFFHMIKFTLLTQAIEENSHVNLDNKNRHAFSAVWNVPSYDCFHKFGVDLQLSKFGIETNAEENDTGEEIVIFYEANLGLYPHYNKTTLQAVNGGLPQLANLSKHLEKATDDILAAIPDEDFSGLGIIDWELWRPQWEQNFDLRFIYRNESVAVVQSRHPSWDDDIVSQLARLEFEQAAKNFMDSTLRLVKQLRPNGRWGFYHFPYCYNKNKPDGSCATDAVLTNNNITWLFDASTALYPSIYIQGYEKYKKEFVAGKLSEAFRVRDMSQNKKVDIYAYTRFNYSHSSLYYSKNDLNNSVLQAANMGCSGVVFWGDANDSSSAQSCSELRHYLRSALGPLVERVTSAADACGQAACSGHGRCVGDILRCADGRTSGRSKGAASDVVVGTSIEGASADVGGTSREDGTERLRSMEGLCSCDCYEGWRGSHCDKIVT